MTQTSVSQLPLRFAQMLTPMGIVAMLLATASHAQMVKPACLALVIQAIVVELLLLIVSLVSLARRKQTLSEDLELSTQE